MDMKTIDAYEEKYKYELPLIHKEFMSKYDGLSLDNGCTFYSLEELDAVNKELQVNIYQPDTIAIGVYDLSNCPIPDYPNCLETAQSCVHNSSF